jgi:oxygen-dependent protoporphyrinogen oxidase
LADALAAIPHASAATVNLAYRSAELPRVPLGFGFVAPRREGLALLGCTFVDQKFEGRAPSGFALMRCFLGDHAYPQTDADAVAAARRDLDRLLGIAATPVHAEAHRWPAAMPHFTLGHLQRVAAIRIAIAALPGLELAGSYFEGVGIPDTVHSAELAAERIWTLVGR